MIDVSDDMDGITPADVAERWLARLMAPDYSMKDKERFEAWLRSAPEHALAYEDAQALWVSLGGLEEDEVVGPHAAAALESTPTPFMEQWTAAVASTPSRPKPARRRNWLPLGVGIAAAVVLGVIAWPTVRPQAPAVPYAATTSVQDVRLADGSSVQLDLDTSISTRIDGEKRSIELTAGRAMFEVAHDAKRLFVVDAGAGRVTALGTRFEVRRSTQDLSVTLLEGSVAIDSLSQGAHQRSLRLVPGQRAIYAPATRSWTVANVDADAVTSWSQGFHVFSATPLADALTEINRYSDVKLKLADPALAQLKLSGSFKLGKGEQIAEALPYALPIKVHSNADTILLSKK